MTPKSFSLDECMKWNTEATLLLESPCIFLVRLCFDEVTFKRVRGLSLLFCLTARVVCDSFLFRFVVWSTMISFGCRCSFGKDRIDELLALRVSVSSSSSCITFEVVCNSVTIFCLKGIVLAGGLCLVNDNCMLASFLDSNCVLGFEFVCLKSRVLVRDGISTLRFFNAGRTSYREFRLDRDIIFCCNR